MFKRNGRLNELEKPEHKQHRIQGFSPGRTGGSPQVVKILYIPTNQLPSPLFDQSLSPSTEFCPRKFQKFYLIFSQFRLLFSSKLHQKALFYA